MFRALEDVFLMRGTIDYSEESENGGAGPRLQTSLVKLALAASRVIESQSQPRGRSFCGNGPVKFEAAQQDFGEKLCAAIRLASQEKIEGDVTKASIIELEGWIAKMQPIYPKLRDEFDYIQAFLVRCQNLAANSR